MIETGQKVTTKCSFVDEDKREFNFLLTCYPNGIDQAHREFISLEIRATKLPEEKVWLRAHMFLVSIDGAHGCAMGRSIETFSTDTTMTCGRFFRYDLLQERNITFLPQDKLSVSFGMEFYSNSSEIFDPTERVQYTADEASGMSNSLTFCGFFKQNSHRILLMWEPREREAQPENIMGRT